MNLFFAEDSNVTVCWDQNVLKVKAGTPPLGSIIMLLIYICIMLFFTICFASLFVAFNCPLPFLEGAGGEWWWGWFLKLLFVEAFLFVGMVFPGWMVKLAVNELLPFSAEIYKDEKIMIYGTKLHRRKCLLSDDAILLTVPINDRGAWGFDLRVYSGNKNCLLVPIVYVGSYSRSRLKARELAWAIQECLGCFQVEESKWWQYH